MNFDQILDGILQREQGYVDHPSDRGGPTTWGITQTVARMNGYAGDMRQMPVEFAREVYRRRYITAPAFDRVWGISNAVGAELIDTGVNMGPAVPSIFFQRWLNGFNLRGKAYPDLFVDGRIGAATLQAFTSYLRFRGREGEAVMVSALNAVQGSRYLDLAEANETQEDFLYGWLRARVMQPVTA